MAGYQLLFTPGAHLPVKTERTSRPNLAEMQKTVGGMIEFIGEFTFVDNGKKKVGQAWVDEEGRLTGKPFNAAAVIFLHNAGVYPNGGIVGDMVVYVGKSVHAN